MLAEYVPFQVAHMWRRVTAEFALQLLAMNRHVQSKTVLVPVHPVALCALEGLRSMELQMSLQDLLSPDGERTFGALERTFLLVTGSHVYFQFTPVRGGVIAQFALVILRPWGVPVVALDVLRQAPLVGVLSSAVVTLEFRSLAVCQRM